MKYIILFLFFGVIGTPVPTNIDLQMMIIEQTIKIQQNKISNDMRYNRYRVYKSSNDSELIQKTDVVIPTPPEKE
jgi:hypothetical protein